MSGEFSDIRGEVNTLCKPYHKHNQVLGANSKDHSIDDRPWLLDKTSDTPHVNGQPPWSHNS